MLLGGYVDLNTNVLFYETSNQEFQQKEKAIGCSSDTITQFVSIRKWHRSLDGHTSVLDSIW